MSLRTQCEVDPSSRTRTSSSCSTSTVLASVITGIATATVIFVLVQIAVCKHRPKATLGVPEARLPAFEEEEDYVQMEGERGVAKPGALDGQEYLQMNGADEVIIDPTYMEVGENCTFSVEDNEAYGQREGVGNHATKQVSVNRV